MKKKKKKTERASAHRTEIRGSNFGSCAVPPHYFFFGLDFFKHGKHVFMIIVVQKPHIGILGIFLERHWEKEKTERPLNGFASILGKVPKCGQKCVFLFRFIVLSYHVLYIYKYIYRYMFLLIFVLSHHNFFTCFLINYQNFVIFLLFVIMLLFVLFICLLSFFILFSYVCL